MHLLGNRFNPKVAVLPSHLPKGGRRRLRPMISPILLATGGVVTILYIWYRTKKSKQYHLPDTHASFLPEGKDSFSFTASHNNVETTIRLSSDYLYWNSNPLSDNWKVLEVSEIAGSKLEKNSVKQESVVTVYAWCSPVRKKSYKQEKIEAKESSGKQHKNWLVTMASVFNVQIKRLFHSILYGGEGKKTLQPIEIKFHFSANVRQSFVTSKLLALRFHRLVLHSVTQSFPSSQRALQQASNMVTNIPEQPEKRHVLFVINPRSGNKESKQIIEHLKSMLSAGEELITPEFIETTHSKHAIEIGESIELNSYSTIVCVGGDGIPHEIINGIMKQPKGKEIFNSTSLAVIPAGTGNGITTSLGIHSPQDSLLRIIRGTTKPLDIFSITQENNPDLGTVYALLQASYGMMADVDFESEPFRYLGDFRFTLLALHRLIFLRRYMVTLSYDVIHKKSVKNGRVVYETVPEAESHVNKRTVSIWCGGLNTDWMAKDFRCVPFAKLDDGLIHLLQIPFFGKISMLQFFFEMSLGTTKHLKHPVELISTKQFSITPEKYPGVLPRLDVDGEEIPILSDQKVTVTVLPSFAKVIA